jgi:hypothetical protein
MIPMMTNYPAESEEPGSLDMFLRFAVGATGAIASTSRQSPHIVSVTRTGAGVYKCVLDSFYDQNAFFFNASVPSPLMDHSVNVIGAVTTTDGTVGHLSVDNMLNGDASGVPYVTISFTAGADGTAADVKSGNEVSVRLTLKAHA